MGETLHDSNYLNTGLDSIKTANDSGLNNLSLTNTSYSSTTNVPKGEPKLIEQLLKAAEELYKKLDKDLADIRSVGEGFATMDNFLEGQSIDLGFQVASAKVTIADLSQYAATSLDHLLEKEVPIVEGYNDQFGKKKGGEDDDDGGGNGSGGNGGGGGGGNPTPTPVATEPKTEGRTEGKTEPMSEPTSETDPEEQTEPVSEVTTEVPSEVASEVKTEPTTSAPVEPKTEAPGKEDKPTGGTNKKPNGGKNKKPKNPNTETKPTETPIVDPNQELPTEVVSDEPIIIDEPYVEPEVEPEITIDEPVTIDLDENVIPKETPKKSNTGRVVAGVITGLGLAGGAAAGYGYYKKKQEDKEYEDYGYEEGEDE